MSKKKKKNVTAKCEMVVGNYVCEADLHCIVRGYRVHITLGLPGIRRNNMSFKCCSGEKCIKRAEEIIQITYGKEAVIQIIDLDTHCHRIH